MRNGLYLLVLLLGLGFDAEAQPFVKPSKIGTLSVLAIEINDNKDLDLIRSNIKRFYGTQKIRINGSVDISKAAAVVALLDDLDELQLLQFNGTLNGDDIEHLSWVNNVTLWVKGGSENQLLLNSELGKLNRLTLIFDEVPDNYEFFMGWKVRGLRLIAPFVKSELPAAIRAAKALPQLKEFGISADAINDLPADLGGMSKLETLIITDNLSWMTEKYPDDLPVTRQILAFSQNGFTRKMALIYQAQDPVIAPWEMKHLAGLFPQAQFGPWENASGDTSLIGQFSDFVRLNKNESQNPGSFANPVISSLNDGCFQFEGNNDKDRVFYLQSEAALLIPAGAIETMDGKTVVGEYRLDCSLANKPARHVASGFPLNYDSAGRVYLLSPGVVFHCKASQQQQILRIKEGFTVKLIFLSNTDTLLRFYAFNNRKKRWQHFYDYDYDFDDTKNKAIDYYTFYAGKKTGIELYPSDSRSLDYRFQTEGYHYLLEPGMNKVSVEPYNGFYVAPVINRAPKMGAYTLRMGRSLVGLRKELVDKKNEKNIIRFSVYDKTETLFPELKPLFQYPLEIESNMDSRAFGASFIRGAVYQDIRFEQEGSKWFMDLRTESGYWRFALLQPQDKVKKQTSKTRVRQQEFNTKMARYLEIRTKKEAAFAQFHAQYREAGLQQAKRVLMYGQVKPKGQSVYSFTMRSFGSFAWAKPMLKTDTGTVNVKFTTKEGIPIDVKQAWLAHYRPFCYQYFGATDVYDFNIVPNSLAYIIARDHQGRSYYINPEKYKARGIKSNSLIYLPVEEIPKQLQNSKELETIMGIKP
jgi:hypothetical protein